MRLTPVLNKTPLRWYLKNKWLAKGKFYRYPASPPKPVLARGVEVVDAYEEFKDRPEEPLEPWQRPDHPLFDPPSQPEDHPDYHDQPIYEFRRKTRLSHGENQVCILTKTQPFYGLPKSVTSHLGSVQLPDQDVLAQRCIMQANVWDPSKDRFPKRYNNKLPGWNYKREWGIRYEKRTKIVINGMVRLSSMLGGTYPDLLMDRIIHPTVYFKTHFNYLDKRIQIHDCLDYQVTSKRPLQPFAGDDVVDASTQHTLPDMYPMLPTIDLEKVNIYQDSDHTGFRGNTELRHPHTIILSNKSWPTHQQNAKLLMFLFGQATLAARHRFGADVKTLPEPVCVQAVSTNGVVFHFGCFQLNTLDFSTEHGIKNLVWFDNDNFMYQRIEPARAMLRNTLYQDYDPEVLRKLFALYVNGADLSIRRWDHPNEAEQQSDELYNGTT